MKAYLYGGPEDGKEFEGDDLRQTLKYVKEAGEPIMTWSPWGNGPLMTYRLEGVCFVYERVIAEDPGEVVYVYKETTKERGPLGS